MSPQEGPVFTTSRKVIGNILPLVLASPFLVQAFRVFGSQGPSVALILWICAFLVAAWVFLGLFGFIGTAAMRKEVGRRMHLDRAFDRSRKWFVGFARPSFRSALDPHEDVGFLILHPDRIEFWGSVHKVVLEKRDVTGVRFRSNTHTLVGLGRWISVEAVVVDKPVRLLVEPREKPTLIANFFFGKRLLQAIRSWKEEGPPAVAGGPSQV
jgi:hypothetical protein